MNKEWRKFSEPTPALGVKKKMSIARLLTFTPTLNKDNEAHSTLSINNDQDMSFIEGGSCPSTPHVKRACRLVVLGSIQTGKTCVINRFLKGTFGDCYVPTIENFHRKLYRIHGEFYQLDILEVGGNDPFPASRRLSLLTGDMFLLIFGVDNQTSYDEVLRIREQIIELKDDKHNILDEMSSPSSSSKKSSSKCRVPIVIAANKTDLPYSKRSVDLEEVRCKVAEWTDNCAFIECSAKTNSNVDELFLKLFQLAKLPKQMSPGMHRHVDIERSMDSAVAAIRKQSPVTRLRSKHSEPALSFDADAKRPSLRTDLLLLQVKKSQQSFISPGEQLILNHSPRHRRNRKCVLM